MKLSFGALFLSLVGGSATAASGPITHSQLQSAGEKRRLQMDFQRAMASGDERMAKAQQKHKKNTLMSKIMSASRKLEEASRTLQNNNYQNGYANGEYSFENYEWMNPVFQQMIEDGVFDMTARAFKYSGCAAIKSYDIDRAGDNGNPMIVDTYAVFRLCPEDSCNKYSLTGCGKNYGEYVVDLKTYLGFMLEFYDDRYGAYCEYCYPCDYDYQVLKHQSQGECYEMLDQMEYQYEHTQQKQAWEDYYQQNYGDMANYAGSYGGNRKMTDYSYFTNQDSSSSSSANAASGSSSYNSDSSSSYNANSAAASGGSYNANSGSSYNNVQSSSGYQYQNGGNAAASGYNGAYGGGYGNQANGQYQNWWQQQNNQENANGEQYGYYNENGEYVDVCAGSGYTDSNGVEYNVDCNGYQSKMMQCSDGALCDYCEYQIDLNYMKCDDYICKDYYTYCSDFYEEVTDDDEQFDLFQFLECNQYENEYGQMYYVGPHCGSDHFTISLGVFEDENCLNYIGETVSLAKVLGYNRQGSGPYGTDEATFFHLPHECVSCDGLDEEQNQYQQYQEENSYGENGVYGEYVAAPDAEVDGVVAMCAALWERSAQCNVHMTNYNMMVKYMEDLDMEYEQRYCNFIDNIVYGAYDESGEILLKPDTFDLSEWRNPEQYKKIRMPAGQAIGLALSATLVVALSALAFFTQRSLTRQSTPWRPKRASGVNMDAEDINRTSSGIGMARSQSGVNAAPLI